MSKHFYPALFTKESDGFSVSFPDLEGAFTEGDTWEEAYKMSSEALGLYLSNENGTFNYPKPSDPTNIKTSENQVMVIIEFDEMEYVKKHNNAAVKKTLTIPSWLNVAAESANINFSQTLQEALKDKLHIV